jgi:hypothetical protein
MNPSKIHDGGWWEAVWVLNPKFSVMGDIAYFVDTTWRPITTQLNLPLPEQM